MAADSNAQSPIWFCPFELDTAGVLRRNGVPITPAPTQKAIRLLNVLVARRGDTVTRLEAKGELWPERIEKIKEGVRIRAGTDDLDDELNHLVRELRDAFGDDADRPRYIQTVHKKGWSFICPIQELQGSPQSALTPLLLVLLGMSFGIAACWLVLALWGWYIRRPPVITRVSAIQAEKVQQITIEGYRLGHYPKFVDSDTPFLAIWDVTKHWSAGRIFPDNFDDVTLNVDNWTDTQIVVTAFSGRYGQNGWELSPGDEVLVEVWNPQTCGGRPAECPLKVGPTGAPTCPR